MTLEELEQLKADGMVDDRKYQQLKSYIEMNGYDPNKNSMANYTPSNLGYNVGADSVPYQESKPSLYDRGGIQSMIASQEIDRGAKIRQLESQIAMVKERIERNKRALVGKSYEDVNKKLAQLEMKKIGMRLNHNNANTDPTSLWRWNQGRLDTKEANAKVDGRALQKWGYETLPTLQQEINPYNYQEQREQLKNVRTLIANGRALGASKEQLIPLLEKEAELTDLVSSTFKNEANSRNIKSKMAQLEKQFEQKTITAQQFRDSIQELLDTLPDGYDEIRNELETKLKFGKKKATPSPIPQV